MAFCFSGSLLRANINIVFFLFNIVIFSWQINFFFFPFLPSRLLPLRSSAPLKAIFGVRVSAAWVNAVYAPRVGLGQSPERNLIWYIFMPFVATFLRILLRINRQNFAIFRQLRRKKNSRHQMDGHRPFPALPSIKVNNKPTLHPNDKNSCIVLTRTEIDCILRYFSHRLTACFFALFKQLL